MTFEYPRRLRFRCVKCGICCGNTKEKTRHVLLLREEAKKIALATRQEISGFALEINDKSPYSHEMRKDSGDGKCVFLKKDRCVIYSKRPLICRCYPFGLETRSDKRKIFYFTKECPEIGKGKLMREKDFQALLNEVNKRLANETSEDDDEG